MSKILPETAWETLIRDESEASWEREVEMLRSHDKALRARVARLEAALRENAIWQEELQQDMIRTEGGCLAMWRGCVATAKAALGDEE